MKYKEPEVTAEDVRRLAMRFEEIEAERDSFFLALRSLEDSIEREGSVSVRVRKWDPSLVGLRRKMEAAKKKLSVVRERCVEFEGFDGKRVFLQEGREPHSIVCMSREKKISVSFGKEGLETYHLRVTGDFFKKFNLIANREESEKIPDTT